MPLAKNRVILLFLILAALGTSLLLELARFESDLARTGAMLVPSVAACPLQMVDQPVCQVAFDPTCTADGGLLWVRNTHLKSRGRWSCRGRSLTTQCNGQPVARRRQ
jgi:hypothetical protein